MDKTKLNILLIEDNPADALFLREALAQDALADFDLTAVESLNEALELLKTQAFAASLLDLGLPDSQGLSTFLKLHQTAPDLPVVVLSALDDEEVAAQAVQAGAQDYLVKRPQDFPIAGRAVRYAVERERSQSALRESEEIFRTFIEQSHDGIMLSDEQGKVIEWNHAIEQISELDRDVVLGKNLWDIQFQMITQEKRSQITVEYLKSTVLSMLKEGKHLASNNVSGEFKIQTPQGEKKIIAQTSFQIYSHTGYRLGLIVRDITERKLAEKKLIENEQFLKESQRIANMGSWRFDPATFKVDWSENCYRLYGYEPYEVEPTFELFKQMVHPEDIPLVEEASDNILQDPRPFEYEYRIIDHNGRMKWLYNNLKPVIENGQVVEFVGSQIDITERKQAEEALRLQSAALNATANEIIITDVQGTILWVNPAWCKVTGYTLEEALGKNPRIVQSGKYDQAFYKEMWDQILAGETWHREMFNKRKDGTLFQEDVTISPVRDNQGRITHFVGVKQEITERKQAEQKIRESETLLRQVLESSQDIIFAVDQDYRLLINNQRHQKVLVETGGHSLKVGESILPPDYLPEVLAHWRKLYDRALSGESFKWESEWPYKDGNLHTIESRFSPLCDANGANVGVLVVILDITDRKQTEIKLKESEAKFHALFDNTPLQNTIWHFIRDEQGEIVDWQLSDINAYGAASIGLTVQDAIGKSALAMFGAEVMGPYLEVARKLARTRETIQFETHFESNGKFYLTSNFMVGNEHYATISLDITARKQAEESLQQERTLLRTLIDNLPDYIFMKDTQSRFLVANQATAELMGVDSPEKLLGKTDFDFYPKDIATHYFEHEQRIMQSGESVRNEENLQLDMNQKEHWLSTTKLALTNPQGQVIGLVGIEKDITERRQAEQKLRESEQKLRSLVESETHFVIRINMEGHYTYWNEKYKSEFGWLHSSTDLRESSPLEAVCEHHHALVYATVEQCVAKPGEVVRVEIDKPARDGSIRTSLWEWVCLTDENGRPSEIQCMGIEITENKKAEREIKQANERFNQIADNITDIFWVFNPYTQKHEYANLAFERTLGHSIKAADQLPNGYLDLVHPDDRQKLLELREQEKNGLETDYIYRIVRPDGQIRWLHDKAAPIVDDQGAVTRIVGTSHDITAQRESETRFATIVEHSPIAIIISRVSDRQLIQINSAFSRLFGFTPEETLGHTTLDLGLWSNPADREKFLEIINTQGYVRGMEITARTKSGEERSVILWGELIEISGEKCLMAQVVDITERKHAEVLLNHRLEDLALINKLNTAVNQGKDLAGITELLANETIQIFGGLGTGTFLVDPHTQTIVLQPFRLPHDRIEKLEKMIGHSLPQITIPIGGNDHFNRVLNSNHGLLITDPKDINDWLVDFSNTTFLSDSIRSLIRKLIPTVSKLLNIQSVIAIPLIAGNETLGIIEFVTEKQFDEKTLERLQNVRHQLAEVIIRKRAEQSLRESEEKYRLLSEELEQRVQQRTAEVQDLYDHAPAGYHSLDTHGNFIEINQTQLNWSGYAREEMLGHSFRELLTPQSRVVFDREFPIFKERGFVRDMEFEMSRKDGSTFPVLINAIAIYDANGNYVMSRSTVFDNTERKQAEQAIRESEETYRSLFESANDAIFLMDIATRTYVRVNSRAPELLGLHSPEELVGRNAHDFIDPSEGNMAEDRMQTILSGERIPPYERTFRRVDGTPVKTEINLSLIRDSKGQPKLLQSVVRDITLRKQAEEVLRENEAQLRISRDKLSAANVTLEKASRMKDEFLSSMSHELRTPLTGILGLSEALQFNTYGPLTEKQNKALRAIEESGRHLLDLINDILDLSKIEAGMLDLSIDPVSLGDVCQASLQLTKGMANKKKQSVRFSMEPPSLQVRGDARRIKQMLVNLLSNAIKFTPENGSLGLEVKGDEKEKVVRLTVWDKGIGIAPENLERLFQPFVQLESSLSRQYEGTGLGLSLVQRMADLQGGSVQVESIPGEGSRFTILLPWAPDITQPNKSTRTGTSSIKKALIVEDREIDAGQLTRYLHVLGIESITHNMGHGVAELAECEQPDIILLDLHLPDQSGFDVLSILKSNPNTRNIPVIFCSVEEKRSLAISLGAAAYLIKPLSFHELRDEIEKVASLREQNSAATSNIVQSTVLIVDDNEVVIETISDFLEAQNFRVASVRSGIELLEVVADLRPDLILMDIQMPVMDGLEATRRVRAHPDRHVSQVPIIAVTALAMPGDRERCLAAGANEYMSKPIGLRHLVETIRGLLKNK